jgi:hypothetical protein
MTAVSKASVPGIRAAAGRADASKSFTGICRISRALRSVMRDCRYEQRSGVKARAYMKGRGLDGSPMHDAALRPATVADE